MPFTLSHTAAVLPLLRYRKLNAAALLIGCMTPDFGYFLRFPWSVNSFLHSSTGAVLAGIPLAAAVFTIAAWLREEIRITLPAPFRRLFEAQGLLDLNWSRPSALGILMSFLLGLASHTIWDHFTHGWGYFVHIFPVLNESAPLVFSLPYYNILQHLSTIVGLAALLAWMFRLLTREQSLRDVFCRPEDSWMHALWSTLFIGPLLIAILSQLLPPLFFGQSAAVEWEIVAFHFTVTAVSSFAIIYALILIFLKSRKRVARTLARPPSNH